MPIKKTPSMQQIIDMGGEVSADKSSKGKSRVMHMRMPTEFSARIEKLVKERPGMTRTSWILEAINEKFKREEK